MTFHCLTFITVVHARCLFVKDTSTFTLFEDKHGLIFINFLRCTIRSCDKLLMTNTLQLSVHIHL
jgi:hypothetical protein